MLLVGPAGHEHGIAVCGGIDAGLDSRLVIWDMDGRGVADSRENQQRGGESAAQPTHGNLLV